MADETRRRKADDPQTIGTCDAKHDGLNDTLTTIRLDVRELRKLMLLSPAAVMVGAAVAVIAMFVKGCA